MRKDENKKAHAKYSASGSERWLKCPGSIRLSEKMKTPPTTSRWAIEGTHAHSCLEFLVNHRKKQKQAIDFLKKKYPIPMIGHAVETLRDIEMRLEKNPAELLVEVKAELPVDEPGQFGTVDIVLVEDFGLLTVMDYKYGAGVPVIVENNSQLIYYALGVAHQFHYNFSSVEIVVAQPRLRLDGKAIRSQTLPVDELIRWRDVFNDGIRACKKPNAPLMAGKHCKFCPAQTICPEYKNVKLREAQSEFDDDVEEEEEVYEEELDPAWDTSHT